MATGDFAGGSVAAGSPVVGHQRLTFDPQTMHPQLLAEVLSDVGIQMAGREDTVFARFLRLERYAVTHMTGAGGTVTWRPSAGIGENRFLFVFVARGRLSVTADETRLAASEEAILVAFPGRTPLTLGSASPAEVIAFTFDADDVAPLTLTPETVGVMRPSSSVFLASYSLLRALVGPAVSEDQEEDTAALRSLLHGTACGLLRAARTPGTSLRESALEIIAEQHTNPALNAHRIAAQLSVSTSTLYRAFVDHPLTLAAHLRQSRAETAAQRLSEDPKLSLAVLSDECGFGSVSSLRRALIDPVIST